MLPRIVAAVFGWLLIVATVGAASAEVKCGRGLFPSEDSGECLAPSEYNRLPLDDDEPMRFSAVQITGTTIFLQGTGRITENTPAEFAKFMGTSDGQASKLLYLHSRGGSLMAGLKLGEAIRKHRLNTSVGRTLPLRGLMQYHSYPVSMCASACAYAFLGGVTRDYDDKAMFGVHRFGSEKAAPTGDTAQVVTSILSNYLERMGVSQSVLIAASTASFEHGLYLVPVQQAKEWRIIFDPSGRTNFVVEQMDGKPMATFEFSVRDKAYRGAVFCDKQTPAMLLADKTDSVPAAVRAVRDASMEFRANGKPLFGRVTYIPSRHQNAAGVLAFTIPGLSPAAFTGKGLFLWNIQNPRASSDLVQRIQWADAVTEVAFTLLADNAERTLPLVLNGCKPGRN